MASILEGVTMECYIVKACLGGINPRMVAYGEVLAWVVFSFTFFFWWGRECIIYSRSLPPGGSDGTICHMELKYCKVQNSMPRNNAVGFTFRVCWNHLPNRRGHLCIISMVSASYSNGKGSWEGYNIPTIEGVVPY